MDLMKTIEKDLYPASRIRSDFIKYRLKKTQKAVSMETSISQGTISRFINGLNNIPLSGYFVSNGYEEYFNNVEHLFRR